LKQKEVVFEEQENDKVETFTELKEFVDNPDYGAQKENAVCGLTDDMIDPPIIELFALKTVRTGAVCLTA
jgi:hypothetical protein